jgi:hypothetical protein
MNYPACEYCASWCTKQHRCTAFTMGWGQCLHSEDKRKLIAIEGQMREKVIK